MAVKINWRFVALGLGALLLAGLFRWWQLLRIESSQDRPILAAAQRYRVPPALVKAVVWRESKFNPKAVGSKHEIGLMQIMGPTAEEWAAAEKKKWFRVQELYDPWRNTEVGAWYLGKLLRRYQQTDNAMAYALADYNAGRGNVLRWCNGAAATNSQQFLEQMTFPGTRDYVQTVLERYQHYREIFPPRR